MNSEQLNIDRAMVSLFFEIKRNMPFEQREEMKISSPTIGTSLVEVYQNSSNKALKRLIRDFMQKAGEDWLAKIATPKKTKRLFSKDSLFARLSN